MAEPLSEQASSLLTLCATNSFLPQFFAHFCLAAIISSSSFSSSPPSLPSCPLESTIPFQPPYGASARRRARQVQSVFPPRSALFRSWLMGSVSWCNTGSRVLCRPPTSIWARQDHSSSDIGKRKGMGFFPSIAYIQTTDLTDRRYRFVRVLPLSQ